MVIIQNLDIKKISQHKDLTPLKVLERKFLFYLIEHAKTGMTLATHLHIAQDLGLCPAEYDQRDKWRVQRRLRRISSKLEELGLISTTQLYRAGSGRKSCNLYIINWRKLGIKHYIMNPMVFIAKYTKGVFIKKSDIERVRQLFKSQLPKKCPIKGKYNYVRSIKNKTRDLSPASARDNLHIRKNVIANFMLDYYERHGNHDPNFIARAKIRRRIIGALYTVIGKLQSIASLDEITAVVLYIGANRGLYRLVSTAKLLARNFESIRLMFKRGDKIDNDLTCYCYLPDENYREPLRHWAASMVCKGLSINRRFIARTVAQFKKLGSIDRIKSAIEYSILSGYTALFAPPDNYGVFTTIKNDSPTETPFQRQKRIIREKRERKKGATP